MMERLSSGFANRSSRWAVVSLGFVVLFGCLLGIAHAAPTRGLARTNEKQALAPVLLVDGGDSPEADAWYHTFMDSMFGSGNWDLYDMSAQGLPNPPELFQGVLGPYQGVLWHVGTADGMNDLQAAAEYLADYIQPDFPGSLAGRLVLVVPPLYLKNAYLPYGLSEDGLGIQRGAAPSGGITIPETKTAFTYMPYLDNLVAPVDLDGCTGIRPMGGAEVLYQMEYCICYGPRVPYDPIVGVRNPERQTSVYARTVTLTVPMHMYGSAGWAALETIMKYHLGFVPTSEVTAGAGKVRLNVNSSGYLGNFFQSSSQPSLVYPYPGYVEHLYQAGIWVGARDLLGQVHVSTSSDHYSNAAEAADSREFVPAEGEVVVKSNVPGSESYDPDAVAPWQAECAFHDWTQPPGGNHVPLGVKVLLRAMAWDQYPIDDGVVLEYRVINESGGELRDVYFGFFNDTTVGNVQRTTPYYPYDYGLPLWNYYDDVNGGWRPGDLPADPAIWMMWEHDDDYEEGWAPSWVGCRLLGSSHPVTPAPGRPPVSYNCWAFRHGPLEDDEYLDEDAGEVVEGRYQAMGNGDFDSGITEDGDYSIPYDWLGLLSTGPVASLADGDTLRVTYALVCGMGEWQLQRNSLKFAELAANGWTLPVSGADTPPNPTFALHQNVPNPFNPATKISFTIPLEQSVDLRVFDLSGRLVRNLIAGDVYAPGRHEVIWNGRDDAGRQVASGTYIYRLEAGGFSETKRMVLVK